MTDDVLRGLERAARESPDDVGAWIRYSKALDRSREEPPADLALGTKRIRAALRDDASRAQIVEGDEVWVDEWPERNRWVLGRWRGVVTKVGFMQHPDGRWSLQFKVRPILPDNDDLDAEPIPFRIRPQPDHLVRGLELACEDKVELIARGTGPRASPETR
jgi:hypothetical protein